MIWPFRKRCKHVHYHEELGDEVRIFPTKVNGRNTALMDTFIVCDDCGLREPGWKRVGESDIKPGQYTAR